MNNKKLISLTKISRDQSIFYEKFLDWEKYTFSEDLIGKIWFMDETLISIYGTSEYNNLSLEQKKKLGYLETCQIIYTYASTEAIMCLFLARLILKYEFGTPYYKFILREQIEEYRHQDMFERGLGIINSKHIKISKFWKFTMKIEALIVPSNYFFILQVVIEIISGDFGRKCIDNKEVSKLTRDLSMIHEIEEARHIEFAQIILDDAFINAGIIKRTIGGWFVLLDIIFINMHYIKQDNFKNLGEKNYKQLFKVAKSNWKKSNLKNFNSKRGNDFLNRYKFITPLNQWAFRLFLGFK